MPWLDTRWTTTRWVLPRHVRSERIAQLQASSKYKELFDQKFLDGLEKRKDTLESTLNKLFAIQIPLLLLLAFSLLNLDVKIRLAGFSLEGVRGLREIILIIATILGVVSSGLSRAIGDCKEILKAATNKLADGKADIENLLNVRYGLQELSMPSTFDPNLSTGRFHILIMILAAIPYLSVILALIAVVLGIQFFSLRDIWLHPNCSRQVSLIVIVFVIATETATLILLWLHRGFQPLQTWEDSKKLDKLQWKDRAKYDEIIREIAQQHVNRGFVSKLFYRPHMRRVK